MVCRLSLPLLLHHSTHILLHKEIPLIFDLKCLDIVDQLADTFQGGLFNLDGLDIEEEGHSETEAAVREGIVVEGVIGGGQFNGEFLVYWHRGIQGPVIKRVWEVSRDGLEECG